MDQLNITERQTGDIAILAMNGDITFGEGNITLRKAVRRLIGEGKKKIILDMSDVRYVDSSGIGELISSLTAIKRENGQIKLLNLSGRIKELLAITKLLTVFDIFDSEADAVSSFDQTKAV